VIKCKWSSLQLTALDRKLENKSHDSKVVDYFAEKNLEMQLLDPRKKTNYEVFESLRIYIERNGRPFNYLQPEQELFQQHTEFYQ
jgi:adenylate kinase